MALALVTAPTQEPVTTAEAKTHLRVSGSSHDTLIDTLINAARRLVEETLCKRALTTQTWDLFLDGFPPCILVPRPPLASGTTVKYVYQAGTLTTISAADYRVDTNSAPARITPAYNVSWPTTRAVTNAVEVRFVAGYGNRTDVPQEIKQIVLLLVGVWFEHPEAVSSASLTEVPWAVSAISSSLRVHI